MEFRTIASICTCCCLVSSGMLALACSAEVEDPSHAGSANDSRKGADDESSMSSGLTGSCIYENRFSASSECKAYTGSAWTVDEAAADCDQQQGTFAETACDASSSLGVCSLSDADGRDTKLVFLGDDEEACSTSEMGCEVFAGGDFTPSATCGGTGDDKEEAGEGSGGGDSGGGKSVYTEGPLQCVSPLDGEPGLSDGEVCTRSMIGACTEPGRIFDDYASCEPVFTQRPYYPVAPANEPAKEDDPRLEDEEYMSELDWVKGQVESCGCVCCHSESRTPQGASNWDIDAGPLWVDTFKDTGLAMGAGWVDSSTLGAFPEAENNGFARDRSGIPTTDEDRMIAFFEDELARRGKERDDFKDVTPFGGPIYAQTRFEPKACENGEGVASDGEVTWTGGGARYVYVLEEGSDNPGTPPNWDTPEGTIWRVQVPPSEAPLESGITYGVLKGSMMQEVPPDADTAPPVLEKGTTYYLYVLADIGIPITRCLFDYE